MPSTPQRRPRPGVRRRGRWLLVDELFGCLQLARSDSNNSQDSGVGVDEDREMNDQDRPYATAAAHYLRGRPPYSRQLSEVLRAELALDGTGALIDVGCGPGTLAVQLAPLFDVVIGIDPEPAMLAEARRYGTDEDVHVTWIEARAEDLDPLDLPRPRLVTFGQSIHWTDRQPVLAAVYRLLQPGGSVALIAPTIAHGEPPIDPPAPPIPHEQIEALIGRYLDWSRSPPQDTYETTLQRSPFGGSRVAYAAGRRDIIRTTDEVVSNYLSMSFAAPDRFGDRLDDFIADLDELLIEVSPSGLFHDWPGDTAIIWATKPP
jgi:ubiquinone/menaquinone biosynthesis C-methylase UbiE